MWFRWRNESAGLVFYAVDSWYVLLLVCIQCVEIYYILLHRHIILVWMEDGLWLKIQHAENEAVAKGVLILVLVEDDLWREVWSWLQTRYWSLNPCLLEPVKPKSKGETTNLLIWEEEWRWPQRAGRVLCHKPISTKSLFEWKMVSDLLRMGIAGHKRGS